MIDISTELKALLESRASEIQVGVEIYSRDTVDIASIKAPANALARFSDGCFTWSTSYGDYEYEAKITDFPSVKTYLDGQQNEADIIISNVARGINSGARFVLDNKIKGTWMVIRLIFPEIEDENWVIWWGKSLRPGKIDNKTVTLSATQEIGNYKTQVPFRSYGVKCPLTPGKGDCLGDIPLTSHSVLYQQQYAKYGTMLCPDRTRSTCIKLGNEQFFQGQPSIAISGTFSYIDTSEDAQKKNKKKKLPPLKTESWSTINQSETTSEVVNLAFGRCQIAGHPITWADKGTEIISIQGFCEGIIGGFDFIKCRNTELTLGNIIEHYGEYGGGTSQGPDTLFGGFSGLNSKLAYLEVVVTGSKPTEVDGAPLITAVIRGLKVPVPNANGEYILLESSNNPVHIIRFLFTDQKYGRVPTYRMADTANIKTADYCDELVEDRTQCESIVLPTNEYNDYGEAYRRYRSTSAWTAYRQAYTDSEITGVDPWSEQPLVNWYVPFSQPPLLPKGNVLRQRFTLNGHLQEKTALLEFIQKRLLPCFRGWINYNREGQIEIRTRIPADNGYIRSDIPAEADIIPINNISQWRTNRTGYLLIGVGKTTSEIRKVTGVLYSPGCNDLPVTATTTGSLTATVSPIVGGSLSNQGVGYIDIGGTVEANSEIKLTFNTVPNDFYISYVTDGVESLQTVTRMVLAFLNANTDFSNYLTAYIVPNKPNRIYIRCEAGFLQLNEVTEYAHTASEEVLRVDAVFENCNELDADTSSSFDNIVIDSFNWNDGSQDDEVNSYSALYTSAVDDFHIAKIVPRTSWDTVELEGDLNEEELDLKFVDNYWQAAYITKSTAIEKLDGNIPFTWRTGISGYALEMGDVVAVRHDSGDGELRYVPVWIKAIAYNLSNFTTDIQANLYLSAAWDHRVQPIEPLLTTTLNPSFVPFTPDAIGSHGGYGSASELPSPNYGQHSDYYGQSRFSPDGVDRM